MQRQDTSNYPLQLSDDVDLEMYSSPKKGITPMRNLPKKNSLRGSNFRVHRNQRHVKKLHSRSRVGSLKPTKESIQNGMSSNLSQKRYGSVPKKLVNNSFPYIKNPGVFNYPLGESNAMTQKKNMNIYKRNIVAANRYQNHDIPKKIDGRSMSPMGNSQQNPQRIVNLTKKTCE